MSPMGWLREQRLQAARAMLARLPESGKHAGLEFVATACGFGSVRTLKSGFRARFGRPLGDDSRPTTT
jgi:transcriptional regulator GlxA family with amidase domain